MNKISKWGWAAASLLFMACSQEETEEWHPSAEEQLQGKCIVEFAIGTDEEISRAIQDKLPANQLIHSLHYLLYNSEGALEKVVNVPDIDNNTQWPLKRDNMTWNQWQALKDTLATDYTYTVLLLANVDPNQPTELSNKESLSTAEIVLPATPYEDNTMPYIWKKEIKISSNPNVDSRKEPQILKVRLQRLISRLDISAQPIKAENIPFTDNFQKQLKQKIAECVRNALEGIKGEKVDWRYVTGRGTQDNYVEILKDKFSQDTYIQKIYDKMPKDEIYKAIAADPEFKLRNEWTNFTEFALKFNQPHNRFPLNTLKSRNNREAEAQPLVYYQLQDKSSLWLGFSGNAAGGSTNLIESISLKSATPTTTLLDIPITMPYPVSLKKNERKALTCNPVTSVEGKKEIMGGNNKEEWTKTMQFSCTLDDIYGDIYTFIDSFDPKLDDWYNYHTKSKMITAIKTKLKYQGIEGVVGPFVFNIRIPGDNQFIYTATLVEKASTQP